MDDKNEIRIILIGKSGSGKSGTGNAILGGPVFGSGNASMSLTTKCSLRSGRFHGYDIIVVDTPGVQDTSRSREDIAAEVKKSMMYSFPGPHAFLLCVPMNKMVTTDNTVIERYQEIFGDEMVKNTIMVFTMVDNWVDNRRMQGQNIGFDEFITTDLTDEMRDFRTRCSNRHHFLTAGNNDSLLKQILNLQKSSVYKNGLTSKLESALKEEEKRK